MAKILIADDDQAIIKLYQVGLQSDGFDVITAENGEECVRKATSDKPDMILLDVMMPKKDGMSTLKELKNDPLMNKIPVIMLTNFGQEEIIKEALAVGAVDYLLKYKITPKEMAEKINQILNPKQVQL